MPAQSPDPSAIACTLPASDMPARVERWSDLTRDAQLFRQPTGDRVVIAFRRDPATEAVLSELVELERQCCPFLSLEVTAYDEVLQLDVSGPPEAQPILALFANDPDAP